MTNNQKRQDNKIPILQVLFVDYYPFRYKPCVEIIIEKSGIILIRKTQQRYSHLASWMPMVFLNAVWLLFGSAIWIVAQEAKSDAQMGKDPRLWMWSVGSLLAFCGTIACKVWVLDILDVAVHMANEMIQMDLELAEGMVNLDYNF